MLRLFPFYAQYAGTIAQSTWVATKLNKPKQIHSQIPYTVTLARGSEQPSLHRIMQPTKPSISQMRRKSVKQYRTASETKDSLRVT